MSEQKKLYRYRVEREEAEKEGERYPLAGSLYYQHPEPDERYPSRFLTLSDGQARMRLSRAQALALLGVLLDDLPHLVEPLDLDDALIEEELQELHLVHAIHDALDSLSDHQAAFMQPEVAEVARRRLAQAEIDAELMATLMDNWNTALEKARARL
jgi:hypothetical protein